MITININNPLIFADYANAVEWIELFKEKSRFLAPKKNQRPPMKL